MKRNPVVFGRRIIAYICALLFVALAYANPHGPFGRTFTTLLAWLLVILVGVGFYKLMFPKSLRDWFTSDRKE